MAKELKSYEELHEAKALKCRAGGLKRHELQSDGYEWPGIAVEKL